MKLYNLYRKYILGEGGKYDRGFVYYNPKSDKIVEISYFIGLHFARKYKLIYIGNIYE